MQKPRRQLVIVPGHAIPKFPLGSQQIHDEENWLLLPYQRNNGQLQCLLEHIEHGCQLLRSLGPDGLLMFSGGITRPEATWSEAAAYFHLAGSCGWLSPSELEQSVALEEAATDSYTNLLLSLAEAVEFNRGIIPETVTVVGWEFKRRRIEFHAATLGLNVNGAAGYHAPTFTYVGVNQPPNLAEMEQAEEYTLGNYYRSPHGAFGPCAEKRRQRYQAEMRRDYPHSIHWPLLAGMLSIYASVEMPVVS